MHSDSFPPISSCTRRLRRPPCALPSCTTVILGSETCTGLRLFPPDPISPPPRRRPPRLRLGAMRLPAPPCRSGWRRGPGCAAPSGPPCDVRAYRTAWSAPGRLQAPGLRTSVVRCVGSFRWYLSYCLVAAAAGGPLASHYGIAAGPPEPTEWAGAGGIQPSQTPPCRRCACARRGRSSSCPP